MTDGAQSRLLRPALGALLALWLPLCGWDLFERSVPEVEEGISALEAGDAKRAVDRFQAAAKEVPSHPVLHYDLGLAHLAVGDHDEALAALAQAVSTPDKSLRAKALAAIGATHAAKESWQEASDAWKRSLMLDPAADDVRHNFEIAWLHLNPPCAAKEDPFEDNDAPGEGKPFDPKVLEEGGGSLTACPGDPDWFVVGAPAAHALRVTVRTETEGAILATTLLAPDGSTLREAVSEDGVARMDITHIEVEGHYQIGIVLEGDVDEAAYTLEPMVLPPCPEGDDGLEDNDVPADARPLEKGTQSLRICPNDDDWFAVSAGEGEDLGVNIQYDAARGSLHLTMFDGEGHTEVATSESGAGKDGVFLEKPKGSFLVRVRGGREQTDNVYQIEVTDKEPDSDGESDPDDQNDRDDEDEKDKDQDDKDKEKDKDEKDEKDEKEKEKEKEKDKPKPEQEKAAQDALDVLRSLEEDDKNLALERALRQAPPRRTERDW